MDLLIDNLQEWKRSAEAPEYFVKAYETNFLILVEEYANLMDMDEFKMNAGPIKEILKQLSKAYIFEDIGYCTKNYENWGYRDNKDIICIDLGYVYSLKGQEHLLSCPICRASLKPNAEFTGYVCANPACKAKFTTEDLVHRMDMTQMDLENKQIEMLTDIDIPDFDGFTEEIISRFISLM